MANPYQQPGGGYGAPQYYVPGAIYPGTYYATPQGFVAQPAGQQYGVSVYGMPSAMPQYQVPQQPAAVVPQVRALSNPLDGMFGSKPAAVTLAPTPAKPPASSVADASWMSPVAVAVAGATPAVLSSKPAAQTDFGSFASAPPVAARTAPTIMHTGFAPISVAPVLTPSPVMVPSVPSASAVRPPMAPAPRVPDDDFGRFVSPTPATKPSAQVAAMPPTSFMPPSVTVVAAKPSAPVAAVPPPSSLAPPLALVAPAPAPVAAKTPPVVASISPVSAPSLVSVVSNARPPVTAPTPVAPALTPAPPAIPSNPAPAPMPAPIPSSSSSATTAAADAHPKTSKKAVDWSKVNVANVFADIEQESALAAQFTPVYAAAPSLSSAPAVPVSAPVTAQTDDWGSFQAPAASPAATSSVQFVPTAQPKPPSSTVSNAAAAAMEWGSFAGAAPAAPGHHTGAMNCSLAPSLPSALAPTLPASSSSAAAMSFAGALPPGAAQTASVLFSSFGVPAPSAFVNNFAPATNALRSTAPSGLAAAAANVSSAAAALSSAVPAVSMPASIGSVPAPTLSPRKSAPTTGIDFGDFVATSPASRAGSAIMSAAASSMASSFPSISAPTLPSDASAAIPSVAAFAPATPLFSSLGPPSAAPQRSDDFGEFASAAPVKAPAPAAPATSLPTAAPSSSLTSAAISLASAATSAFSSISFASSMPSGTPTGVEFGGFSAPLSPSPAAPRAAAPPASAPVAMKAAAVTEADFGEFSLPSIIPSPAPVSVSPSLPPSALASATAPLSSSQPKSQFAQSLENALSFAPLSPAPAIPTAATDDEWGGFEAPKSAAPGPAVTAPRFAAPPLSTPAATKAAIANADFGEFSSPSTMPASTPAADPAYVATSTPPAPAAQPPRPMLSAEALLGRAMRALDTRSEDDFGSFSSGAPAPAPAVPKSSGASTGFGFLFAGPPLASALAPSPGSPMIAALRPQQPASEALTDVLAFLIVHERFEEAIACKAHMDGKGTANAEQMKRWRSSAAPAGHLTAADMRKQLNDALGAATAEKHAAKFVDYSEADTADLATAAAKQRQAHALLRRLLATKGADLTDARRAALQAIAAELNAAQDFASHVLLKSSLAGAEEEAVKKGVWNSPKGNNFFRGLTELHLVYRRISQSINEEGSDLMLSGLQASVSVAWNTLFATLASEAKRVDQESPLFSAKDADSVCGLCGLNAPPAPSGVGAHASCQSLQRHANAR